MEARKLRLYLLILLAFAAIMNWLFGQVPSGASMHQTAVAASRGVGVPTLDLFQAVPLNIAGSNLLGFIHQGRLGSTNRLDGWPDQQVFWSSDLTNWHLAGVLTNGAPLTLLLDTGGTATNRHGFYKFVPFPAKPGS